MSSPAPLQRALPALFIALATAAALLTTPTPAQADKGFHALCDGTPYFLGSGTGLPSAKKDLDRARGRWGTADNNESGPATTNSGFNLIPVTWSMTATSDVTGEVVFDGVLWSSNGHRQQDTITCTFQTQLIHPDDPDHTGTAHHTIIMVHRP